MERCCSGDDGGNKTERKRELKRRKTVTAWEGGVRRKEELVG